MDSVKGGKLLGEIIAKRQRELEAKDEQVVEPEAASTDLEAESPVVRLVRRWTAVPFSDLAD